MEAVPITPSMTCGQKYRALAGNLARKAASVWHAFGRSPVTRSHLSRAWWLPFHMASPAMTLVRSSAMACLATIFDASPGPNGTKKRQSGTSLRKAPSLVCRACSPVATPSTPSISRAKLRCLPDSPITRSEGRPANSRAGLPPKWRADLLQICRPTIRKSDSHSACFAPSPQSESWRSPYPGSAPLATPLANELRAVPVGRAFYSRRRKNPWFIDTFLLWPVAQ